MEESRVYIIRHLKAIEKSYEDFFFDNNLKILNCVNITGLLNIDIQINNYDLPVEIINAIENVFLVN